MNKYVAKYTTLTTEIIAGDLVRNHLGQIGRVKEIKKLLWGFPYIITLTQTDAFGNEGEQDEWKLDHMEKLGEFILCNINLKEVGKVSKYAKWVREGQWFLDQHVNREVLIKDSFDNDYEHRNLLIGEEIKLTSTEKLITEMPIKILGPCGYFH